MEWRDASADEVERGLAHFSGLRAAADAELCRLIQAVDHSQSWMSDGARSLAEWVGMRLSVRFSRARRLVAVARRLESLPQLMAGFSQGEVSLDQVEAISRIATPDTETTVIAEALGLSQVELERRTRKSDPPTDVEAGTVWGRRRLVRQWNLDSSELRFWGNLPGDAGEIFDTAIHHGVERIPADPVTGFFDTVEARAADALTQLAATTGDQSSPPQVTLHADLEALTSTEPSSVTELGSGALVPNQTARRLACDAVVETAVHDRGRVVGVGRNSRTVPRWLRRQVEHRDGNRCRFPGCEARRWLQAHHVRHWADGGPTDLDNLILLCGFHHRFLHEHGWTITPTRQTFQFRKPDQSIYPSPKPGLHPRLKQLVTGGPSP